MHAYPRIPRRRIDSALSETKHCSVLRNMEPLSVEENLSYAKGETRNCEWTKVANGQSCAKTEDRGGICCFFASRESRVADRRREDGGLAFRGSAKSRFFLPWIIRLIDPSLQSSFARCERLARGDIRLRWLARTQADKSARASFSMVAVV